MKRAPEATTTAENYRRLLLARRTEVLAGLGANARFDTLARMGRIAEDDQAQLSHDEFISLQINSLDYTQLRLVDEALDRLDAGDYGVCLECEEPIPAKRLAAVPWARYCVACQDRVGRMLDQEMMAWRPRVGGYPQS
jgi:DnaK suppressor protein